jgi:hypothetical protein
MMYKAKLKYSLLVALACLSSTYAVAYDKSSHKPLLPEHRIVAYYGNFYSPHMGVLGEYPEDEMLGMLQNEVHHWNKADSDSPVIPAIEYIAVVAQGSPGKDGMYRARMPDEQIQKAIDMANKIDGIVILDVQVGMSNVHEEIPRLEKFLALPNVMLAIDPEFSMVSGDRPGSIIGTMDAEDINYVAHYLEQLVRKNDLPPKVLIVHRFTHHMVTNAHEIKPLPEVQIVMDMDGWGDKELKLGSYRNFIVPEPVQFTGFKLFYKNDTKEGGDLYSPAEILKFNPVPMFIMYQ